MKKYLINVYYDLLMWLEEVFGGISVAINDHRKRIDKKYWDRYLS